MKNLLLKMSFARPAVLALVVSIPGSALADRIPIRSGEHEGFSRLALDLPRAVSWTLATDASEAQLSLSGIQADFDLRDTFRKLSTGRVAGLTQPTGQNTLAISLGCDCMVNVFRLGERMLVVDIIGARKTAAEPTIGTNTPGWGAPASQPEASSLSYSRSAQAARQSTLSLEIARAANRVPLKFATVAASDRAPEMRAKPAATLPLQPVPRTLKTPLDVVRTQRLSEAERRLAEQLSRAVSQGLVTPRMSRLPALPKAVASDAGDPNQMPPAEPDAEQTMPGLNLRAQTSADRDFIRLLEALPQTKAGQPCLPNAMLDIASWASGAPFGEQVGALRAALVGEFDRPDPDAAQKLVQLYIHFGFGAEALQVLAAAPGVAAETPLLQALGEIMEFGHADRPGPLSNQFECDTNAALWAILAHAVLPSDANPNAAAVLRAVSALPHELRLFLGPIASERLIAAGHTDIAAQVLRIVDRGLDQPDTRFEMADAQLKLTRGELETAEQSLGKVVGANTDLSPKALIALIDTRLDSELPLDIQIADLAGAYALEYRKSPLGAELKRVHILALAESGDYDGAFHELSLFTANNKHDTNTALRSHAMGALAREADDVTFLKYALNTRNPDSSTLTLKSANAVAARLIELGFARRADVYLRPGAKGGDSRDRRLLRARSALAQAKPWRVEAELLGLSEPDAALLRAQAHSMKGDHAAASRLFATLQREDEIIEEAWLAADWATLRDTNDPLWVGAADMVGNPADLPEGARVLARNRALIEHSAAARKTMAELLNRLSVESAPRPREQTEKPRFR